MIKHHFFFIHHKQMAKEGKEESVAKDMTVALWSSRKSSDIVFYGMSIK